VPCIVNFLEQALALNQQSAISNQRERKQQTRAETRICGEGKRETDGYNQELKKSGMEKREIRGTSLAKKKRVE
jgi:hypothetical protein